MQKVLLLLSILITTALAAPHIDLEELRVLWEIWKRQNRKSYEPAEEQARFAIFTENFKKVSDYNNKNTGVRLVLNKFGDLTLDEFTAYHTGSYLSNRDIFDLNTTNIVDYSGFELPDSVDWRLAGAVTAVHDQMSCGSSWAWSAVGALEALKFITTGELVPLSVQQLIDCDTGNHGCDGGWYNRAFNYTAANGLLVEADYPYAAYDSDCKYDDSKTSKVNSGYSYVQPKSAEALKASLAIQPVALSIQAYELVIQFYRSGVIKSDCGDETDHAVLGVGYTTVYGEEAFIIKNTLGPGWGQNGYAYVSTDESLNDGHGACGILFRPVVPTI